MVKDNIIIGIDPGTTVMGYGVIHEKGNQVNMLAMGIVDLRGFKDHYLKLQRIFNRTVSLIDQYKPDELAIEAPFFGKNVQSMLKLGRAQGVAIAACLSRDMVITEYSPREIKQAITGNGAASKEQVAGMLKSILKIDVLPKDLDATDGVAAALCHHYKKRNPITSNGAKSWSDFIKKNPERIK